MTVRRGNGFGIFGGWIAVIRTAVILIALASSTCAQQPADPNGGFDPGQDAAAVAPAADPPGRVARLSFAEGTVSEEPASLNQFTPAQVNDPLTTGDRVWADTGAVAEIEAGQLAVRMGQSTDLTVTAMTDTLAQFGLGQGSVHLRTYALDPGTTTELDTPNVAVTVLAPGDVRVDVDPNEPSTVVTVLSGQVEVDGNGLQQTMNAGQSVRLAGTDPLSAQWLQPAANDPLDHFSADRDEAYEAGIAAEQSYVNPDTVGAADLQQYGAWDSEPDYGGVWFPTVAAGWQPYCYGRWTWVAPWGWTWVENEPWGFAPFHYGRWAVFGGRWGWIPGPPVVHPVYAPALVVFVHPGNGVSAWFPLGPKEPYAPWYHASTRYTNRVNVSNLYTHDFNRARTEYNVSNRELFTNALGGQRQFVNRGRGTIAVPQQTLASGRPVRQALLHVPGDQLSAAPVMPHPMVTPERTMVAPAAARAVPPRVGRPTLTSHEDAAIRFRGAGAPGPRQTTPMRSSGQAAPVERRGDTGAQPGPAEPGRQRSVERSGQQGYRGPVNGAVSTEQPNQPAYRNAAPGTQPYPPPNPVYRNNSTGAEQPHPEPNPLYRNPKAGTGTQPDVQPGEQPNHGRIEGGVRPPNPGRGTEQLPQPNAPAARQQEQVGRPQNAVHGTEQLPQQNVPAARQQEQLYNRAVPPPARPSFDQQRQAIQSTDPGRPLSPQQMDNIRENRPAGQPQVREAAPHPAPPPPPPPRIEPQRSSPPPPPARSEPARSSPPPQASKPENNKH